MCRENNRLQSSRKEATHTDRTVQHASQRRQERRAGRGGGTAARGGDTVRVGGAGRQGRVDGTGRQGRVGGAGRQVRVSRCWLAGLQWSAALQNTQVARHARGLLATVSMGFSWTHTLFGVSRAPRGVRC